MNVVPVRLGRDGIAKQIFLGAREADIEIDYLKAFIELARRPVPAPGPPTSPDVDADVDADADAASSN